MGRFKVTELVVKSGMVAMLAAFPIASAHAANGANSGLEVSNTSPFVGETIGVTGTCDTVDADVVLSKIELTKSGQADRTLATNVATEDGSGDFSTQATIPGDYPGGTANLGVQCTDQSSGDIVYMIEPLNIVRPAIISFTAPVNGATVGAKFTVTGTITGTDDAGNPCKVDDLYATNDPSAPGQSVANITTPTQQGTQFSYAVDLAQPVKGQDEPNTVKAGNVYLFNSSSNCVVPRNPQLQVVYKPGSGGGVAQVTKVPAGGVQTGYGPNTSSHAAQPAGTLAAASLAWAGLRRRRLLADREQR